jgi:hypothetical protein
MRFEIFGDSLQISVDASVAIPFEGPLSESALFDFHRKINQGHFQPLLQVLLQYRNDHNLNDWLYYQLVRKAAQQIAPKEENYQRYTLYKWFLLVKSGYDATLNIYNGHLLFYVYSKDEVYNLPLYLKEGKQYVCLNIHDYARAFQQVSGIVSHVDLPEPAALNAFSYKVSRLPEFHGATYQEKELRFPYGDREYHFVLKVNPQVGNIFANYPTVEFEDYFNIPMSRQTYQSLVPMLKDNLKGKNVKNGVAYLMQFTRYAFLYEDDMNNFGREKRMSAEETLLSSASDCDDRAALFFYLVKEIYNIPMLALVYPEHITIAVQLEKGKGKGIKYGGKKYFICEPTPQKENLGIGKIAHHLRKLTYEVVYAYNPL